MPPDPQFYSPYSGLDANCGNPLLLCLEAFIKEGLLDAGDRPPKARRCGCGCGGDVAAAPGQ